MSKVLLINGSPNQFGCTYTALHEMEKTLNKSGIDTEILYLGAKPMSDCTGCGRCGELGHCVFNDLVNTTVARLEQFDALVVGSPVYYAGPSANLCAFLDRLFYSGGKSLLRGKPGCCVVSCRRGGASASFDRLNKYFTISSMPVVSSQYWNQVHGNTPAEVLKDEEGLQTMRTLADNMAWLIKCIAAGRAAGIDMPPQEKHIATNFIR